MRQRTLQIFQTTKTDLRLILVPALVLLVLLSRGAHILALSIDRVDGHLVVVQLVLATTGWAGSRGTGRGAGQGRVVIG